MADTRFPLVKDISAQAPKGRQPQPGALCKAKEAKQGRTNVIKCTRCPAAHLIPPKRNNWPPICDAITPMMAFGQHSMVPPFYANRAQRTAHPHCT